VDIHYAPTITTGRPAILPQPGASGRHHALPARPLTRRANRLLSPNIDPNNGKHARRCYCAPGFVCEDHRLRL
jgi:hypothetical protein